MPAVALGTSAFKRRDARSGELYATNIITTTDPTNPVDGKMRFQRPGLTTFAQPTASLNRGIFRQAGCLEGDFLVVGGTNWYRVDQGGGPTLLGTVAGSDQVQMAGLAAKAFAVAEGLVYSTNGTTVSSVAIPDGRLIHSIEELNGYIILAQKDSARVYWIAPGETVPDPLSYLTAERTPSNIVGLSVIGDTIWIFKEQDIEVWQPTGDADAPFQRISGRIFDKGAVSRDSIVKLDNTVYWAGADDNVYRADSAPIVISDEGISEQLRKSTKSEVSAWAWTMNGETFYALNLGALGTWTRTIKYEGWSKFKSYGKAYWRPFQGAQGENNRIVCADRESGELWFLDSDASNDDGAPMEREVTGAIGLVGPPQRCNSLSLMVSAGWTPDPAYEPKLLVSWSDDQGATYKAPVTVGLGKMGQYDKEVSIRQCGLMNAPGRLVKIRMTDDMIFRLAYARYNEAFAYGA